MYTKLFSRITESSLIEESITTRWVFVALLAISDERGYVIGTNIAIARRINVTLDQFEESIKVLMSPDPDSNSPAHEGRRVIESGAGRGYLLVNYVAYRDIKTKADRTDYMRNYMQDYRKNEIEDVNPDSVKIAKNDVKNANASSASASPSGIDVFGAWNAMGKPFPACLKLTKSRKAHIRQRLGEEWWVANYEMGLERIRDSKFCRGENSRNWVADIDFFLRPETLIKVMEGKYDNKKSGTFRVNTCESPVHPDLGPEAEAINRLRDLKNEAKGEKLTAGYWKVAKLAHVQAGTAIPGDLKSWFESEERRHAQDAS